MKSEKSNCLDEFNFIKFDFDTNIDSHKGFKRVRSFSRQMFSYFPCKTYSHFKAFVRIYILIKV